MLRKNAHIRPISMYGSTNKNNSRSLPVSEPASQNRIVSKDCSFRMSIPCVMDANKRLMVAPAKTSLTEVIDPLPSEASSNTDTPATPAPNIADQEKTVSELEFSTKEVITAAKAAPLFTPKISGPASAFLLIACIKQPATASDPPTAAAINALGSLTERIIN